METILVVPGLYGSGLQHWQSWLEHRVPHCVRVEQPDWNNPILSEWVATFGLYMEQIAGRVWVVAHSFGCLTTVMAAKQYAERIAGALLVAPANPDRFNIEGFQPGNFYCSASDPISLQLPQRYLGFPSLVVGSTNDPWMPLIQAEKWANRWESRFINLGAVGHINIASGFGAWPQGLRWLQELQAAQPCSIAGDFAG